MQLPKPNALRICVIDDEPGIAQDWAEKLQQAIERCSIDGKVQAPSSWRNDVKVLEARRQKFVKCLDEGSVDYAENDQGTIFDSVDVLFVDYQLLDQSNSRSLTGLEVAYLVRGFSECKIVVALNALGGFDRGVRRFDLTLREGEDRIENLHLTHKELANELLWRLPHHGESAYRPWMWPLLSAEVARHSKRAEIAAYFLSSEAREDNLLELLGFKDRGSESEAYLLPAPVIDHLGPDSIDSTPANFLWKSGHVVKPEDLKVRHSEKNDTEKRLLAITELKPCLRLFAVALHRWLERMVLPSQDVLIDMPHLLMRWPGLAEEPSAEALSKVSSDGLEDLNADPIPAVVQYQYRPVVRTDLSLQHLFSRPVYWWSRLREDESLLAKGIRAQRGTVLVFQEDTSQFAPASESMRFKSALNSLQPVRYCAGPDNRDDVEYEPQSRLAE